MTSPVEEERPRLARLVVWPHFEGAEWQLPLEDAVIAPAQRTLIGWSMVPESVDAGMPRAVAALLAQVLASHATLAFAVKTQRSRMDDLVARPWRNDRHFVWSRAASAADALEHAYDDSAFPWSDQRQVVVLEDPARPLRLDEGHLELVRQADRLAALARDGALGALLPGVDGDVAGLYVFRPALMLAILDALDRGARGAGAQSLVAEGAAFRGLIRGAG